MIDERQVVTCYPSARLPRPVELDVAGVSQGNGQRTETGLGLLVSGAGSGRAVQAIAILSRRGPARVGTAPTNRYAVASRPRSKCAPGALREVAAHGVDEDAHDLLGQYGPSTLGPPRPHSAADVPSRCSSRIATHQVRLRRSSE
jgi:hypothetical protein